MAKTEISKAQGGIPAGGTTGQAVIKLSGTSYDTGWGSVVAGGGSGFLGTGTWMGAGVQTDDGIVAIEFTMSGIGSGVTITDTTAGEVLVEYHFNGSTGPDISPATNAFTFPVKKGNTITVATVATFSFTTETIYKLGSSGISNSNGDTTKDASDASAVQTIIHGLTSTPSKVKITCEFIATGGAYNRVNAIAVYNGTTQSSVSTYTTGANTVVSNTFRLNAGTTNTDHSDGVLTFDATNIYITWTKNGSPTGIYILVWEAVV